MTHDNTAAVMKKFETIGASKIHDPGQPVFTLDHDIQNKSEANLTKYRDIEAFARNQGVDFYPAGTGIGHQVMIEQQYVVPGSFVVASDSHSNMYGAIGALGTPVVRTDAAAIWAATGGAGPTIGLETLIHLSFLICCALATGVVAFMKLSRMGQAIRATAQDPRAARVMGIDTDKVYRFTFCLNGAICGAAGALVAMIWVIQPFYGITYSIRAFVIVTAAGLGNLPGVIAAGLGMGGLEQFGGFILGAQYQQALVVGMLLVVLLIRLLQQSRKRQAVA